MNASGLQRLKISILSRQLKLWVFPGIVRRSWCFFREKSSEKLSKHCRTVRKRFFHVKLKEIFPIPKRPCWLRNQILWKWLILLFSFLFFGRVWWRVWVKSLLSCPTSVSVYPLKGLYHAICHVSFKKLKRVFASIQFPGADQHSGF